jgi:hypothetical protein
MPDQIDKKHCAGLSRRHRSIVQRLARSVEPYRGIGAGVGTVGAPFNLAFTTYARGEIPMVSFQLRV